MSVKRNNRSYRFKKVALLQFQKALLFKKNLLILVEYKQAYKIPFVIANKETAL